jgi:hypothetical protein
VLAICPGTIPEGLRLLSSSLRIRMMTQTSPDGFCCALCFGHSWLREFVRDRASRTGDCPHCHSYKTFLISTSDLVGPFKNLLREYVAQDYREEEYATGSDHWAARPLVEAIQQDWTIFSPSLESENRKRLLADILGLMRSDTDQPFEPDTKVLDFSRFARFTLARYWSNVVGPIFGCYPNSVISGGQAAAVGRSSDRWPR